MKFIYSFCFAILLFPVLSSQAQNSPQSSGAAKNFIEYQWPQDGNIYVPQSTTFISRLSKQIMANHPPSDFSFAVLGEKSGVHTGEVVISDDNQTVIFKPDQPFGLDEHVSVTFTILGMENFAPVSYSFHTTSVSELDRGRALYELHAQEKAGYDEARKESSQEEIQSVLPVLRDTIISSPIVSIDTAKVHEDGNIFFSPEGNFPIGYSFLGITSDTGTSPLFKRDISVGCGNFKMEPDGSLSYFREANAKYAGLGIFFGRYERIDQRMNLIDTFQTVGFVCDEHDFHFMPNNKHAIIISYDPETVDMTTMPCAPDTAKKKALVFGAIIQELDASKNVVKQWRSWDHYSICDATSDINLGAAVIDPFHMNAAEIDSTDGNIIASFRHNDAVTKINWKDGDPNFDSTIWYWGGKHNMFTFTGPNPDDTLHFSHQHDPARIPNGHITLWDNGNLHTIHTIIKGKDSIIIKPSSRAMEYALDEVSHVATAVWEYTNVPYSLAAGNVQRLDNGNTMIGLGFVTQPCAIEVTPTGERVFQLSIQNGAFAYRSYRFPFAPLSAVRQTGAANSFGFASIYPNPAQNQTAVSFSVKGPGMMQIDLLDVLGHTVRSISEKLSGAGAYSADLDMRDLAAGTYYCKLSQNGSSAMKMVVVQK